ncbi:MAG: hypothetical protein PHY04_00015 [Candidatus ainarchaeum sp.]|jgi:hypothetical protein|nr:hypothetical protein [Candidatus ainarchaeum sp.]MDD3085546.1 hypothetical protein [Candidatus ainarchaeum sp.]MDD4128109.1 hypothetical protein [Candidatus ainarchaeum sp.]MDD4467524.1 hypothetical protein [Candidatus ainarchaeum sp.]HPM85635.1 hypothetical protein [archaeon]
MNYKKILSSTYSWASIDNVKWFLIFFWVSLPVIIILPFLFSDDLVYVGFSKMIAFVLYIILYLTLILGFVVLIQCCLKSFHKSFYALNLSKLIELFKLVFLELFYILIWNISVKWRVFQILLIILNALLFVLASLFPNSLWLLALYITASGLALLFSYNFGRVFFSSTVFFTKSNYSAKEAIFGSWKLTRGGVLKIFSPIIWVVVLIFLMFSFLTLAMGSFAAIFLKIFLIDSLAINFGFKLAAAFALAPCLIAYHYAIIEIYSQLSEVHDSSSSIKRLLAHKVLNKKRILMKKKSVVKKKKK